MSIPGLARINRYKRDPCLHLTKKDFDDIDEHIDEEIEFYDEVEFEEEIVEDLFDQR